MKTNYVKSIGLVLLGSVLTIAVHLFVEKEEENNPNNIAAHEVALEDAQAHISAYRTWLKYLPQRITLENNVLVYDQVEITNETDLAYITEYIEGYVASNGPNGDPYSIPFCWPKKFAYQISMDDIYGAIDAGGENMNGIRVYTALRGLDTYDTSAFSKHVYVVPTVDNDNDTLDLIPGNGSYVYDLTTPCPAACDYTSPLMTLDSL